MSAFNQFYQIIKRVPLLGIPFRIAEGPLRKKRIAQLEKAEEAKHWEFRIANTLACPDNNHIRRVEDAGTVHGEQQVMHNGLRIVPGSYHGNNVSLQLQKNQGVHEPEEERVFQEVLPHMPKGATMLELGAYWGFYSMWFQKEVPEAINYLIEPETEHLEFGKNNLALNNMKGDFHQALIDRESGKTPDGKPIICVDDFLELKNIDRLHMLHADIQGFERRMLEGARKSFQRNAIDYAFISTHRARKSESDDINSIHKQCLEFLKEFDFLILAETNLETTYSWDGLIAACRKGVPNPGTINIAKRPLGSRML